MIVAINNVLEQVEVVTRNPHKDLICVKDSKGELHIVSEQENLIHNQSTNSRGGIIDLTKRKRIPISK